MTEEKQHNKILEAFNDHAEKDDVRFDHFEKRFDESEGRSYRMEQKIDLLVKAIHGDKESGEVGIKQKLEPLDNLRGLWKVLGILLGAFALLASGVAGMVYLWHLFFNQSIK